MALLEKECSKEDGAAQGSDGCHTHKLGTKDGAERLPFDRPSWLPHVQLLTWITDWFDYQMDPPTFCQFLIASILSYLIRSISYPRYTELSLSWAGYHGFRNSDG